MAENGYVIVDSIHNVLFGGTLFGVFAGTTMVPHDVWTEVSRLRQRRGKVILKAVPLLPERTLLRTRIRPL